MPRAGWKKPESDRRLSDLVSVGVLTRVFPPDLVDEVIAQSGRTEQRHRALPARVMAYFSIGMALYSEGSYEDVLAQLTDGLSWASGWSERFTLPSKSAIFQARARLGSEPVAALFARVARPIGQVDTPGVWLAGRRLVAVDGTCLDVADTAENAAHFGRPGVSKGEQAAFPMTRVSLTPAPSLAAIPRSFLTRGRGCATADASEELMNLLPSRPSFKWAAASATPRQATATSFTPGTSLPAAMRSSMLGTR